MKYAVFFQKETIEMNIYMPRNTSLTISIMHVMHNHFTRNLEIRYYHNAITYILFLGNLY